MNLPVSSPRRRGPIRRVVATWCGRREIESQWLWVPAFAGTTADGSVPTTVEEVSQARAKLRGDSNSDHLTLACRQHGFRRHLVNRCHHAIGRHMVRHMPDAFEHDELA